MRSRSPQRIVARTARCSSHSRSSRASSAFSWAETSGSCVSESSCHSSVRRSLPRSISEWISCSVLMVLKTSPEVAPFPPSGIAELVQAVLVDAEVVGQLVQHGDTDLVLEQARIVAEFGDERAAEDADPVGHGAGPVAALGQRRALVETEEIGILAILLLDRDLDVRDRLRELGRERVERPGDVVLERHQ